MVLPVIQGTSKIIRLTLTSGPEGKPAAGFCKNKRDI